MACLLLPDVSLAAALRAEPELRQQRSPPISITDGTVIVSGWLRGLSVVQARAVQPDLVLRPLSLEGVRSAQEALVDAALSISPRVEDVEPGLAFLDLAGSEALFPTWRGLLTALEMRLADVGLETVRMGIGPTCSVAMLAARHREGGQIVSPVDVRRFLDPLPLDLLDPPDEVLDRLTRWGVQTLGELCRIPRPALGARLGKEAVELARRARGEDLIPFRPTPPRLRFEEGAEPESPVADLETLAFLLRGPLDRLSQRLRVRGLAVRALLVELGLESGGTFARTVAMGAPTVETASLLSLVRLALEKDAPQEPVERLRVIATPGSVETAQLDLFLPPLPAPAELAVALARLEALCGPERVGAPGIEDTHRPDAARVERFLTNPKGASVVADAPLLPRATLALRALRPPRRVRVQTSDGAPRQVELASEQSRVTSCAGPWRLFGEWWGESCFARDYFDVELSNGRVVRMYHNLEADGWFVDGIYD